MICNGKHCPILSNDVGSSISIQFRHKNGRKDETVWKEKRWDDKWSALRRDEKSDRREAKDEKRGQQIEKRPDKKW